MLNFQTSVSTPQFYEYANTIRINDLQRVIYWRTELELRLSARSENSMYSCPQVGSTQAYAAELPGEDL